jgi:hypothetical protein
MNTTDDDRHQRGTPKNPLSTFWRYLIFGVMISISTLVATLILMQEDPQNQSLVWTGILAASGSWTCLLAFIYDATVYSIAWQILIFVTIFLVELNAYDNLPFAISKASEVSLPISAVSLLSMFAPFLFDMIVPILLNPLILSSFSILPALQFIYYFSLLWKGDGLKLSSGMAGMTGFALCTTLLLWYKNRTHKFINFLPPRDVGIAFVSMVVLLLCTQSYHQMLLPAWIGATLCTLICTMTAAAADVWNTVGTNQFWMVSLDMGALVTYSVIPTVLLLSRVNLKFGTSISMLIKFMAEGLPGDAIYEVSSPLFVWLTAISNFGLFYTKSLCPLGAHFYGKIYTSGMPYTKNVSLCIDWCDAKLIYDEIQKMNVLMNFIVSYKDLTEDKSALKAALHAGHIIVPYTGDRKAQDEYRNIFGGPPEWAHGLSYPSDILACSKSNTKIVLWSIQYHKGVTLDELLTDIKSSLGGNVICIENCGVVETIQAILSAKFSIVPLDITLKEHRMTLSRAQ